MIHRKWDRPPITILLKRTLCFFVGLSLETPYLMISLNLNLRTFHVNFNWNELKWARISGAQTSWFQLISGSIISLHFNLHFTWNTQISGEMCENERPLPAMVILWTYPFFCLTDVWVGNVFLVFVCLYTCACVSPCLSVCLSALQLLK